MTTIACDREIMVADSKVVMGSDLHYRSNKKIVRVKDKIVGAAGLDYYIGQFLQMMRFGELTRFTIRDCDVGVDDLDFIGIVLDESGIWIADSTLSIERINEPFYAIGSGGVAARAAMMVGADPKTAVKIAAKLDSSTGLPLVTLRLKRKTG